MHGNPIQVAGNRYFVIYVITNQAIKTRVKLIGIPVVVSRWDFHLYPNNVEGCSQSMESCFKSTKTFYVVVVPILEKLLTPLLKMLIPSWYRIITNPNTDF